MTRTVVESLWSTERTPTTQAVVRRLWSMECTPKTRAVIRRLESVDRATPQWNVAESWGC